MRLTAIAPALVAFVTVVPSVRAQSPVITPKGDPSVRNDSIYALAVDSTQHPEETTVTLLDDGVVKYEIDGTGARTYRTTVQILRQQAVDGWSENTFRYNAEREQFTLNWARVVKPDGTVISAAPIHVQEGDEPVPEQSPVYSHYKVVRISLGSVAPGTIVDYSYTIRTIKAVLPGDFVTSWFINPGATIRRSRLILDVPRAMAVKITEYNLDFKPAVSTVGGRIIRTWYRADIPRFEPELFVPDSNGVHQHLLISGAASWASIGKWYAGLLKDRYTITPALNAKLAEITAGAKTRRDSLLSLHRWVAQDVRYVSIQLGEGSFQPRMPEEVMRTMAGDCKDKATLFVTLARKLGYEAYPVLASLNSKPERTQPSVGSFDHAIAAIRIDGAWHYVDLTADIVPFDDPPIGTAGEFALVIHDDGTADGVDIPDYNYAASKSYGLITGTVDTAGLFVGRFSRTLSGNLQYSMRRDFSEALTAKERADVTAAVAGSVVEGASGDSLQITRGLDLNVLPSIAVNVRAEHALKRAAHGWVFTLPLPKYASPQLVAQLEREKPRVFPFDAAAVMGPATWIWELRLGVPTGWKADLPDNMSAKSAFGTYEVTYAQDGDTVTVVRKIAGVKGVLDKSLKPELIGWLRGIGNDDASFIVLQPPSATATR